MSPLLRRPFGIHRVQRDVVSVLYEVVGKATEILSQRRAGDGIGVLLPLGNGFDLSRAKGRRPVIVAGGMGVAPLAFLARKLASTRTPLALVGARTASHVLCETDLRGCGCAVKVATDDGSKGFGGYVTELLESSVTADDCVYACGPAPMLKEVCRIARHHSIPAQVSLEAHMSCGFGACLGCVVNTVSGYVRVCKEGPVFDAQDIVW